MAKKGCCLQVSVTSCSGNSLSKEYALWPEWTSTDVSAWNRRNLELLKHKLFYCTEWAVSISYVYQCIIEMLSHVYPGVYRWGGGRGVVRWARVNKLEYCHISKCCLFKFLGLLVSVTSFCWFKHSQICIWSIMWRPYVELELHWVNCGSSSSSPCWSLGPY